MKYLLNWSDMHIHPSSPNSSISDGIYTQENAATKIQANFRGYRVRKQLKDTTASGSNVESDGNFDRKVDNRDGKSKDECREEKSATKIQAGVRGYLVRKKQKLAIQAAVKIQAVFRGHKVRTSIKQGDSSSNHAKGVANLSPTNNADITNVGK